MSDWFVRTSSKTKKFVKSPGVFMRDFYLKRYPLVDRYWSVGNNGPDVSNNGHMPADENIEGFFGLAGSLFSRLPVFRMEGKLLHAVFGMPAYLVREVSSRLIGNRAAYVAIDGGTPRLASSYKIDALAAALLPAKEFVAYQKTDDSIASVNVSIWDVAGESLIARSNSLPSKRVSISSVFDRGDLLTEEISPDEVSPREPIDIVYTWVNGEDPVWREKFQSVSGDAHIDWDRYHQSYELKYSLRSVFMNAPWVRRIFILSNCSPPDWFTPHPKVTWLDHSEVIPESYLPVFNSHVIESYLWHVKDMAEQFIYLNDDVYFGQYCLPEDFFTGNGLSVSYMEPYGIVNAMRSELNSKSEPWKHAVVNGSNHIRRKHGVYANHLHKHVAHSALKSVALAMEKDFPKIFDVMRKNRFREKSDVPPISYLYHHYAYINRYAERRDCTSALVNQDNYVQIDKRARKSQNYKFYCINDGGGSWKNEHYKTFKMNFGELLFPIPSPCEKHGNGAA